MRNEPNIQQGFAVRGKKSARPWSEMPTKDVGNPLFEIDVYKKYLHSKSLATLSNPNINVREGRNSLRIVGDFVVVFCFLFIFFADNKMSISEIPHQNMFLFVQFQEFFVCEQNLNLTVQPRKSTVVSVLNYSPFYFQCKRNFENKNRTSQTKCYLNWAVIPKLADKQSMLTIKDSLPSRWEVDH